MEQARLVRWLKQVGDTVTQGEPILELETEKSLVEIEATETGRLAEQLLAVDAEVHIGDQAAWLETDAPSAGAAASGGAAAPGNPATAGGVTSAPRAAPTGST